MNINNNLYEYINSVILAIYQTYDKGHDCNHINAVIENSLELAESYDVNIDMIYTIAAYHDIGLVYGRSDHHITSAKWLKEDEIINAFFSLEQITIMCEAIEDHRASSKQKPRTIYGDIISTADRIIDLETIIYRTIEYGKSNYPENTIEEQITRAYEHIQDKYGEGGYLKLNIETKRNIDGLNEIRVLLKNCELFKELCYDLLND